MTRPHSPLFQVKNLIFLFKSKVMILGKCFSWVSCSDIQRKLQQWSKNVRLYLELSAEDAII